LSIEDPSEHQSWLTIFSETVPMSTNAIDVEGSSRHHPLNPKATPYNPCPKLKSVVNN